jgi:hypothetical protein
MRRSLKYSTYKSLWIKSIYRGIDGGGCNDENDGLLAVGVANPFEFGPDEDELLDVATDSADAAEVDADDMADAAEDAADDADVAVLDAT